MKGAEFLHKKDNKLHLSEEVEVASDRNELKSNKPIDKIENYLEKIKKILQPNAITGEIDRGKRNLAMMENYKNKLYEKWNIVIDEEDISDKYWESKKEFYEENGNNKSLSINENGETYISDETKEQEIRRIQADQKESFDRWIEFMASRESNFIPTWAMVWALKGVMNSSQKISSSTSASLSFMLKKRTKDSVAPYPELNQEALAKSIDAIVNKVENGKINEDNPELKKAIESTNFQKIYFGFIEDLNNKDENKEIFQNINGEWKKYNQGDTNAPASLVKDLENKGTGWCTAGYTTAKGHLDLGDMYVYYSEDKNGDNTIPRLTILMFQDKIFEIRGIAPAQNIDEFISPVLYKKMNEFGDLTKEFEPRKQVLEQLDLIWSKHNNSEELNIDDLKFIYEVENELSFFGDAKDPRMNKILEKRDHNKDCEIILADKSISSFDANNFFNLDRLPSNIELDTLNLIGTKVKELPSDLKINNLIISKLNIESLPNNLNLDLLDISETNIKELPLDIKVNKLIATKINLEQIPNDLDCDNINFSSSNVSKLPIGLKTNILNLSSSQINKLPSDLKVKELIIKSTKIKEIPYYPELQVLNAYNSELESLPDGLDLKELNIRESRLTNLPNNLYVKTINASYSKLESLPSDLNCQDLDITLTKITSIPEGIQIDNLKADFDKINYLPKEILENTNLINISEFDKQRLLSEINKLDYKSQLIKDIEDIYEYIEDDEYEEIE